ncbi:MAG: FAD-dependent oxidoreductase, partial [Gammaproteobacteria bacterium]|nr:FAD-dependent oxidoreductase [Gammaproteobacteria bacterium]
MTRTACFIDRSLNQSDYKVRFLPQYDRGNGWYNILPSPPPGRKLDGEQATDWLVIGAGFTGLSAGRRLADCFPDDRIVIVEADRVGHGASGRNAGFAIDLPFIREAHGNVEQGRRLLKIHRAGVNELDRLVKQYSIDCQWANSGKYMVAVGSQACRDLMQTHEFLNKIGEPGELIDRNTIAGRLGTEFYQKALYSPGTYLMNPAALTRGLAANLPANVDLYEDSPITDIRFGKTVVAKTTKGIIKSPRVILATNGFTEAFGIMKNRIFNIMSFASLTPPLSEWADKGRDLLGNTPEWG